MENHTRTPAVHGKSHAWNSRSDWTPRKLTLEFGLTLGWGVGGGSIIFQKAGGLAITTILANIAGTNRSFQILTGSFKIDKFLFWQIKSYLIYQFSNYKVGIAKKYINYVMEKKSSQLFILQKNPICNSLGIKNSNFVGKKSSFLDSGLVVGISWTRHGNCFCLNKKIPFKTNKDQIGVVMMVNEIKVSASNWLSKSNTKMVHNARIPYKNA